MRSPGARHEISLRTRGGSVFRNAYLIPYQIHLTPAAELAQIDQVVGSVEKENMDVAESQSLIGRVQMTDGTSYSFGYTDDGQEKQDEIVTVESSDPATVEVSAVSLREAGKSGEFSAQLTAKAAGSANITVSVRLGTGEAKTTVIPITVAGGEAEPKPVLLDFSQLKTSRVDGIWTVTEYGNAHFTIDADKSYHSSYRMYSGSAHGGFAALHAEAGAPDVSWLTTPNRRLTIDFTVPASGIYTIDLTGGKWYAGGIADVFIDDQYLGDYDFCNYDESNTLPRSMGEKKALRTVALTAGEHEISLRTRGGSVFRLTYFIPYQINLTPATGLAEADRVIGTIERESMAIDETQTLTGKVQMTDGTSYGFGFTDDGQEKQGETVTVESSDPSVVEVSAVSLREAGQGRGVFRTADRQSSGKRQYYGVCPSGRQGAENHGGSGFGSGRGSAGKRPLEH